VLLIDTAYAVAYVVLPWYVNTTTVANPQVCFVSWADGTTKANTFTYSVNIFPNIKTVDENATYGVWNWNATANKNCYMRLASTNTNNTDITSLNVTLWIAASTPFTKLWTGLTDAAWYPFTSAQNTKYAIWIEIQCASGAGVGHTPQFSLEMKVEEP